VVTRWTGSGTHQVEFMRVAATGNQVTVTGITINRISGGKIAESWTNDDALGMRQQIGAVPEPGQAKI
jgi:predicted ester cyclase